MHAIAVTPPANPGERPTLSIAETPTPEPGPGDVLLQVHAAGVNRADLLQARGGYPPPPGASPILGLEAAGTVVAVGEGANPDLIGTRTSALLDGGGYAEYAVAPATQLLPLPDDAAPTLAAALPEALATAWFNLVGLCHLHAGQTVLIQGGSGGVGHIAIRLARLLGARVLTTVGAAWKGERCLDLGADVAIDYHDDVPAAVADATGGRGVDVILDVLGAGALADNLGMLAPHGQLAIIGLQQGRRAEIDLSQLMARRVSVHGSTLRARTRQEKSAIIAAVAHYAPYIEPSVHAVVPLRRAGEAHALMDEPGTFGKVVLQVR
jgi:putative PIG3 family NAD(P)H quinone oxidoreductase